MTDSTGIREVGTPQLVALLALVPPHGRIVEDSRELAASHPHVVLIEGGRPASTKLGGAISRTDLVRQSLRMRPDRLVG
jgi:pilus assembly protein CpaF